MLDKILISHRGNINGVNQLRENSIKYIEEAIQQFDVEIDVWKINEILFLGHDQPNQEVNLSFLNSFKNKLWIHCKNIEALFYLKTDFNCFFHHSDDAVLTSRNYIWTYPGKKLFKTSIAVLPEGKYHKDELEICSGICSDNINLYLKRKL